MVTRKLAPTAIVLALVLLLGVVPASSSPEPLRATTEGHRNRRSWVGRLLPNPQRYVAIGRSNAYGRPLPSN